jgi:hypothetical protein
LRCDRYAGWTVKHRERKPLIGMMLHQDGCCRE